MPEDGFEALVVSVNQSIKGLEEELEGTQDALDRVHARLDTLPEYYIPRKEADVKAVRVKNALIGLLVAGSIVAFGVVAIFVNNERVCREDRTFNRDLITIAVADRQPLATSTPETRAALDHDNATRIRPLRERLLSLDGAQPEKC